MQEAWTFSVIEDPGMACDLDAARIPAMPGEAFYISDFISEEEEAWLLQKVRMFPIYSSSSTVSM